MEKNGGLIEELKEMVEDDSLTLKQGVRLIMRSQMGLLKDFNDWKDWQTEITKRVEALESRDKRTVAKWGAGGVVFGAAVTGLVDIILASL